MNPTCLQNHYSIQQLGVSPTSASPELADVQSIPWFFNSLSFMWLSSTSNSIIPCWPVSQTNTLWQLSVHYEHWTETHFLSKRCRWYFKWLKWIKLPLAVSNGSTACERIEVARAGSAHRRNQSPPTILSCISRNMPSMWYLQEHIDEPQSKHIS